MLYIQLMFELFAKTHCAFNQFPFCRKARIPRGSPVGTLCEKYAETKDVKVALFCKVKRIQIEGEIVWRVLPLFVKRAMKNIRLPIHIPKYFFEVDGFKKTHASGKKLIKQAA